MGYLTRLCQFLCCSCRDFLLCAEAKSVLRVVKFDIKMEPFKFYQFQNVKGLLVKCSEAGNEAAQHVLGKVT